MIIYRWTNKLNNKKYVGQTVKALSRRTRFHINTANIGSELPIHNAIRKYGIDAFIIELIAIARSLDELNALEKALIKENNSLVPNGYNLKEGGNSHIWHPESKKKAGKSAKLRMQRDGGKQFKDAAILGRKALEGKDTWNKGMKVTSKETLEKQSKSHIGQIAWNKRAIVCNETGEVFNSLKEAAIRLGLQSSKVCLVLKGYRKHTRNLTFKYLEAV